MARCPTCHPALRAFFIALTALSPLVAPRVHAQQQPSQPEHVIDVIADHDSRYRIPGFDKPIVTLTAGETVRLRITAIKAKTHARDGSVHGFTLLRAVDHVPVPDWDFLLKPGTQEFVAKAPEEPGEYLVVCTVICSANHEQMTMKVVVQPRTE